MCGIVGVIRRGGAIEWSVLERMTKVLEHRGPDGSGLWVSKEGNVGLGHRRLSIIDLTSAAGQPMVSPRTGLAMVYNGEIYNHRDLRSELKKNGVAFHTDHSDSETLLEAVGFWGVRGALRRLIGMYAFAIYDPRNRKIYLARDRLGVKPLYVAELHDGWAFASEIKSLLEYPGIRRELDQEAFVRYLTFRFVPPPKSLFDGIEKVGAGEILEIGVDTKQIYRYRYWNPLEQSLQSSLSFRKAVDALDMLIESSVSYRLEADVPVGLFVSGGVDSGLLLTKAAQMTTDKLHTFTIRYPGHEKYEEATDARDIAVSVGAIHHEVSFDEGDFGNLMKSVAFHQDEPIAAPVCLPVYLLSKAAREAGVPVIMAGEGGDELFIGYRNWLRLRDIQNWDNRLPDVRGRFMRYALRSFLGLLLPREVRGWDLLDRAAKGQPLFWGGAMDFGSREREMLLGPALSRNYVLSDFDEVIKPVFEEFLEYRPKTDITGWMTFLDIRYRLPELMLPRLDKMGMAHSIEGRVPLLDHRIAEFALTLPYALHEGSSRIGKSLLKAVAERTMPEKSIYRKKKGFGAPVVEWKDSSVGKLYLNALVAFSQRTGLFNWRYLNRVVDRKGSRLYFNLINFMLWYITFIENPVPDYLEFD